MSYILVIWTIVAGAGTQFSEHYERGWRPIGDFYSQSSCEAAAAQLSLERSKFRCLKK